MLTLGACDGTVGQVHSWASGLCLAQGSCQTNSGSHPPPIVLAHLIPSVASGVGCGCDSTPTFSCSPPQNPVLIPLFSHPLPSHLTRSPGGSFST